MEGIKLPKSLQIFSNNFSELTAFYSGVGMQKLRNHCIPFTHTIGVDILIFLNVLYSDKSVDTESKLKEIYLKSPVQSFFSALNLQNVAVKTLFLEVTLEIINQKLNWMDLLISGDFLCNITDQEKFTLLRAILHSKNAKAIDKIIHYFPFFISYGDPDSQQRLERSRLIFQAGAPSPACDFALSSVIENFEDVISTISYALESKEDKQLDDEQIKFLNQDNEKLQRENKSISQAKESAEKKVQLLQDELRTTKEDNEKQIQQLQLQIAFLQEELEKTKKDDDSLDLSTPIPQQIAQDSNNHNQEDFDNNNNVRGSVSESSVMDNLISGNSNTDNVSGDDIFPEDVPLYTAYSSNEFTGLEFDFPTHSEEQSLSDPAPSIVPILENETASPILQVNIIPLPPPSPLPLSPHPYALFTNTNRAQQESDKLPPFNKEAFFNCLIEGQTQQAIECLTNTDSQTNVLMITNAELMGKQVREFQKLYQNFSSKAQLEKLGGCIQKVATHIVTLSKNPQLREGIQLFGEPIFDDIVSKIKNLESLPTQSSDTSTNQTNSNNQNQRMPLTSRRRRRH